MILKVHNILTSALSFTSRHVVIDDEAFKRIQTTLFLMTFSGIGLAPLAVWFNSGTLWFLSLILILPPMAWNQVQMFLVTTDIGEEDE